MVPDVQFASGAEAEIFESVFLGRRAVVKRRSPKAYRLPELDVRIRSSRIRSEARLIRDARKAGVRTPVSYDIDVEGCSITMEYIPGKKVKDVLDEDPDGAFSLCSEIGRTIADMHNAGICHGDLTTSNMILTSDGRVCMIDFSMGASAADLEDLGVDIRLLERAFTSAHPGMESQYGALIDAYCGRMRDSAAVMGKVQEIKDRGRYT